MKAREVCYAATAMHNFQKPAISLASACKNENEKKIGLARIRLQECDIRPESQKKCMSSTIFFAAV